MVVMSGFVASGSAPLPLSAGARQPLAVSFKIVSVKGPVRYQLPLSAEWRVARKDWWVPDGAIMVIPENSKLTVEANDSLGREGVFMKSTQVTINSPMIVRLSRDSFRKVQVESELKSKVPDAKAMKALEKFVKTRESFSDAWKSIASAMLQQEPAGDELLKLLAEAAKQAKTEEAVTVSNKVGKIKIKAPNDREIAMAEAPPVQIPLRWEREGLNSDTDKSSYDVYFWRHVEAPRVYARVSGTTYTVKAGAFGLYNAQVVSADGSYKSKVRKIRVEKQGKLNEDDDGLPGDDDQVNKVLSQRIKALNPGRNLVWQAQGDWPLIGFEWSRPEICADKMLYRVIIKNADGKVVLKKDALREDFLWAPSNDLSGVFTWQVDGISCMSAKNQLVKTLSSTPIRKLTLVRDDVAKTISTAISEPRFRGTIFLDSL